MLTELIPGKWLRSRVLLYVIILIGAVLGLPLIMFEKGSFVDSYYAYLCDNTILDYTRICWKYRGMKSASG